MASAASVQYIKGAGNIDVVVRPEGGQAFKLIYLRVHFRGTSPSAGLALVLQLDSAAGEEFDVQLYSVINAGLDADVNLILTDIEMSDPSPWSFQAGDGLRLTWTRITGKNWTWGIEAGMEELVG